MPPKYHPDASAHKHGLLLSLRKNEFYHLPEFYIRARAWYKAEIDRHLSTPSASDASEQARPAHHQEVSEPRRIQPPRSAKRLAPSSDLAPSKAAKRSRNGNGSSTQKTGDYTLPPKQLERFLVLTKESDQVPIGRREDEALLPGVHVAYFVLGLEGAVEFKMLELLKNTNGSNAKEGNSTKCLLALRKYKYKQGFKPAWEVEEPAEEWRLNRDHSSPSSTHGDASLGISKEEQLVSGEGKGALLPRVVLAKKAGNAGELKVMVESRGERSRTETPAPVAEMQLSPTLGKWRLDGIGDMGGGVSKKKKMKVESLDGKIVETELGLRFAVDLCEAVEGRGVQDGVRILMV